MKRINLILNGEERTKMQVSVSDEAYAIYIDAGRSKGGLIENLLIDAYRKKEFDVVFASKRGYKKIDRNDSSCIYKDAGQCKSALIEKALLLAHEDVKYSVFFTSKRKALFGESLDLDKNTAINDIQENFDVPDLDNDNEQLTWGSN